MLFHIIKCRVELKYSNQTAEKPYHDFWSEDTVHRYIIKGMQKKILKEGLKECILTGAEEGIPGGADDTTGGGGTVTTETENHSMHSC